MIVRPLVFVAIVLAVTLSPVTADAAAPKPATPAGLPRAIEPRTAYVEQVSCNPAAKPGAVKLMQLLTRTYVNTTANIPSDCGSNGNRSEHYEGRAIDWMVNNRNATQAAQANAFLAWLFATDADGNTQAMARRLGVMYIVRNNKIWGSWSGTWEPVDGCSTHPEVAWDTTCHRNHMHISLSWEGAWARTSFWTKAVAAVDYGPCRVADLNWAGNYVAPRATKCPRFALVQPPTGTSATYRELLKYSGAYLRAGMRGPAVMALQRGLKSPVTGIFDPVTLAKLIAFQRLKGFSPTGLIYGAIWRSLLAANR